MLVVIRGAGDLASGIALRLWRSHLKLVMLDLPNPTAIRRTVCFSQALRLGETAVEGVTAVRAESPEAVREALRAGRIPVLPDPEAACLSWLRPDVLVDAILAKRNLGTKITDAPLVIGVGPGFTAGEDCHAVVETMRSHSLGRVIRAGSAIANTNIPGLIGGFAGERVLRAPESGVFHALLEIGAQVAPGDAAGEVNGVPMRCTIGGILRGILPDGTPVKKGMKSGDVDPRCVLEHCYTASDKAIAVGGGVLQAILEYTGALEGCRGENALGV
jgi:xanthine dehydrogenase accessory factor